MPFFIGGDSLNNIVNLLLYLKSFAFFIIGKPMPSSSFSNSKVPTMVMDVPSLGYSLGNLRDFASSKARPCEQQASASLMTQPKKRRPVSSSL